MCIRSEILVQITRVAQEHNRELAPLTDDLPLMYSGLDSLCLAVVVARLDDTLGIDPFQAAHDSRFPVTVGELIALYESVQPGENGSKSNSGR